MSKGIVMFWKKKGGYGFAEYASNGEIKKIFIHYTNLIGRKRLYKNQYIRFRIGKNDRGDTAEDVEVIEDAKTKTNTGRAGSETV